MRKNPAWLLGVIIPAVLLLAWQISCQAGLVPPSILPSPALVLSTLQAMAVSGEMAQAVGATAFRLFSGFVFGALAGTVLGGLTGSSTLMRRLTDPLVQALRSVPSLAWVPLFILWLGIFETSKITLIAVGVFFQSI